MDEGETFGAPAPLALAPEMGQQRLSLGLPALLLSL